MTMDHSVRAVHNLAGGADKTCVTMDHDPQGQTLTWVDLGDAPADEAPDEAIDQQR
jgi:hypothetical protein